MVRPSTSLSSPESVDRLSDDAPTGAGGVATGCGSCFAQASSHERLASTAAVTARSSASRAS
eukprot:3086870-Pyramimonas_sp.AAC.1